MSIQVKKLPFGDTTKDGSYYPVIDGVAVCMPDKFFWHTEADTIAAAQEWVALRDARLSA